MQDFFSRVLQSSEHFAGSRNYWNCSVSAWPSFRRHFRCNMRKECVNEEDEIQCPYSYCSHGGVRIDRRCFFYVLKNEPVSWFGAQRECRLMGASLASLTSLHTWNGVMTWLHLDSRWRDGLKFMHVGLTSAPQGLPYM